MSGTRCFVAIELGDEVRERLLQARQALIGHDPAWGGEKWVAPENLHVTLKFLGNLEESTIFHLRGAIANELEGARAFPMELSELRAVPNPKRCTMVWACFAGVESVDFAQRIERAAVTCELEAEQRPFSPHTTLVRARRPRRLPTEALTSANSIASTPRISMSVLSATLFASTLTRTGPVYETIDSWALPQSG